MKKFLLFWIALFLGATVLQAQESISNVTASQRTDGSRMLDVSYDLAGPEASYEISLEVSFDDGQNYEAVTLVSGDVGTVAPATGLSMVWDAGAEFPDGFYYETMKVRVIANTNDWQCGELLLDPRDGKQYETVQIGDQCWMAENLNVGERIDGSEDMADNGTLEKYCFDDDPANCEAYGGLYQWNEMMQYVTQVGVQGICPEGWHVPSDAEWTQLTDYVVSQGYPNSGSDPNGAGNALKSCRQVNSPLGGDCNTGEHPRWNEHSTHHGFDAFGFGSLPGGYRYSSGSFSYLGYRGYWWSSSEPSSTFAWFRFMHYFYGYVVRNNYGESNGFSLRCLRD